MFHFFISLNLVLVDKQVIMPPRRSNRVKAQEEVVEVVEISNPYTEEKPAKTTKAKAKTTKAAKAKTTKAATNTKTKASKKAKKEAVVEDLTKEDENEDVEETLASTIPSNAPIVQEITIKDTTIEKAVSALSKWNKDKQQESDKKDLFEEEDDDIPLYLSVTSNKYFTDTSVLKPRMLSLSHPIYNLEDSRVCLFVKDDLFDADAKDKLESLKESSLKNLAEIVTVKELKTVYKSYESRRRLLSQYDIFLTDSSIANMIPKLLGKVFFDSPKFPLTVNITDKKVLSFEKLIRNFEKALHSVGFMLPMGINASFKLGMLGQDIEHLKENIHTIAKYLEKFSIRLIQIKLKSSPSLPIYINKKIFSDADIIDEKNTESKEIDSEIPLSIYAEGLKELGLDEEEANRLFGGKRQSTATETSNGKRFKKN